MKLLVFFLLLLVVALFVWASKVIGFKVFNVDNTDDWVDKVVLTIGGTLILLLCGGVVYLVASGLWALTGFIIN
jgi:hypothetical protein